MVFTARVRSTREGNVLTPVFVSVHTYGGGGYPISGLGKGGTPSQVRVGGYPISGLGRGGTPFQVQVGRGYPIPGLGRGVPHPRSRWGGTHSTPPRIASTCYGYTAGGMPLAFTQEDFLVDWIF